MSHFIRTVSGRPIPSSPSAMLSHEFFPSPSLNTSLHLRSFHSVRFWTSQDAMYDYMKTGWGVKGPGWVQYDFWHPLAVTAETELCELADGMEEHAV